MGSREGIEKTAAKRIGVSHREWKRRVDSGQKWCTTCKRWLAVSSFGSDASRGDGRKANCRDCANEIARSSYFPRPRPKPGRAFVPARDNDKKQARRRVNHLVDVGILPRPNDLPCKDCGHRHTRGGMRHEYDHFRGYHSDHHEDVEAVCVSCHRERERQRNG